MKRPRQWCMRPWTMRCDQGMTTHLSTETRKILFAYRSRPPIKSTVLNNEVEPTQKVFRPHEFTDGLRTSGPNATLHNRSRWFCILQRFPRYRIRVSHTHLRLVNHLTINPPKEQEIILQLSLMVVRWGLPPPTLPDAWGQRINSQMRADDIHKHKENSLD